MKKCQLMAIAVTEFELHRKAMDARTNGSTLLVSAHIRTNPLRSGCSLSCANRRLRYPTGVQLVLCQQKAPVPHSFSLGTLEKMAAQNIVQEFLGHLLNAGITSSLELEKKDTSVFPRPGYTEKGRKVEQCTVANNLPCQTRTARGTCLTVTGANFQEPAGRENIAVKTARKEPSEDPG